MNMTVNWRKYPGSDTERQRGRRPARRLSGHQRQWTNSWDIPTRHPERGQAPAPGLHSRLSGSWAQKEGRAPRQVHGLGLREGTAAHREQETVTDQPKDTTDRQEVTSGCWETEQTGSEVAQDLGRQVRTKGPARMEDAQQDRREVRMWDPEQTASEVRTWDLSAYRTRADSPSEVRTCPPAQDKQSHSHSGQHEGRFVSRPETHQLGQAWKGDWA